MTVVASYLYRNGKRVDEVALPSQTLEITAGDFVWIGLTDPTAEELAQLNYSSDTPARGSSLF